MINPHIPWQYRITLRQTAPIVMGLLGCLALMLSLGYFYAREEILRTTKAQLQQFMQSIIRQNTYSRQWVMRSMPTFVHAVEKHIASPYLTQEQMDDQLTAAISNARGEKFVEVHYLQQGKTVSHYYCNKGPITEEKIGKFFSPPLSAYAISQLKKAQWDTPYVDENRTLHIRYTAPLKQKDDLVIGYITISLAKVWLTEHIRSFSVFEQCIPFFLTSDGQWTLQNTADIALNDLKKFMLTKYSGINSITWYGSSYIAIFMPSGDNDVLMGVLIPRKEIFGDLDTHTQILILLSFIILLLATYALYTTNQNFHTPLHQLLMAAETLAKGSFEQQNQFTLPVIRTRETKLLHKAMQRLQLALHQRIRDLTVMTQTRERLEGELRFARSIQNSLRPLYFPYHKQLEVAAFVHESREVCGDMYDCFPLSEHEVCFIIGNVAEHGVPAALLTNRIMPVLHELMLSGFSPDKALEHVHSISKLDQSSNKLLVSALVGIWHMQSGIFTWASAGQIPPFIIPSEKQKAQGQRCFQLPHSCSSALGSKKHDQYTLKDIQLSAGQSILFVPQRLLSLPSPQGVQYGKYALEHFLQEHHLAPQALLSELFDDICTHMQRNMRDDMVLFAAHFHGPKV